MSKRWQWMERLEENGREEALEERGEALHPVAQRLLSIRLIRDSEAVQQFFEPSWERHLHDPMLFTQMERAVERIFQAFENGEHITVHGDYDADGVTGSAVLISTLHALRSALMAQGSVTSASVVIDSYIPHRDKEGYGLHATTVDYLHQQGTSLLVTVDCGIACPNEIVLAMERGIDTIVVDHHQFGERLPEGILIHPKLPGESYPFPHLAAVGVAWKVASALIRRARERGLAFVPGWEKWLLDFVSIATVTDMVPLIGENRVLEHFGLKVLNKTRRPGLRKLIELAGCTPGALTTESISFGLGPRINAAGRMDHASLALKLMLAEEMEEASVLANALEQQNRQRQKATGKMMEEAAQQYGETQTSPIVVLWSQEWSPALVGLVAGKYLDLKGKPVVAIGRHGERWVGSGRSFARYDITEALRRAGDGILTHVGGHVQACGFSFTDAASLEILVQRLHQDALAHLSLEECVPTMGIDAEISFEEVRWELVELLERFEPFGEGNRRPIFATRNVEVVACELLGSQQNHIRCLFRDSSGRTVRCIGFKFGPRIEEFALGNWLDIAYDVGVNAWNGRRDLQCKLIDVRPATE